MNFTFVCETGSSDFSRAMRSPRDRSCRRREAEKRVHRVTKKGCVRAFTRLHMQGEKRASFCFHDIQRPFDPCGTASSMAQAAWGPFEERSTATAALLAQNLCVEFCGGISMDRLLN